MTTTTQNDELNTKLWLGQIFLTYILSEEYQSLEKDVRQSVTLAMFRVWVS